MDRLIKGIKKIIILISFVLFKIIKLIKNQFKISKDNIAEVTFLKEFIQSRKSIY